MSGDDAGARADEASQRDRACYEQNAQQFRGLNQVMWQVPILAITITGGLWFAAMNVNGAHGARGWLFGLAGLLDTALVVVLHRVRYVMGEYLTKLEEFNPRAFVAARGDGCFNGSGMVALVFKGALVIAAIFSLVAMVAPGSMGF